MSKVLILDYWKKRGHECTHSFMHMPRLGSAWQAEGTVIAGVNHPPVLIWRGSQEVVWLSEFLKYPWR